MGADKVSRLFKHKKNGFRMPNNASGRKRLRQSKVRNLRNRMRKSEISTFSKRVLLAVEGGDATSAKTFLKIAQKKIDKAVKKNILHKNTAARRKSSLMRRVAAL